MMSQDGDKIHKNYFLLMEYYITSSIALMPKQFKTFLHYNIPSIFIKNYLKLRAIKR